MTGVNRLVLVGCVVSRPGGGTCGPSPTGGCRFEVSVARRVKDPDGTRRREVERLRLTALGRAAVIAAGCRHGETVYIEGRVRTRTVDGWNLREPMEVPEIVCEYVQPLGFRSAGRPVREVEPGAVEPPGPLDHGAPEGM